MRERCVRVVLAVVVLFFIGGCTGKEEVPNHAVIEEEIEREGKDYIVIGYSQVGSAQYVVKLADGDFWIIC